MVIKETELQEGLDKLFNAPQFRTINTKENLNNIVMSLLKDIYIDSPKEIINNFENNPNRRMINTIFKNYGIHPQYYEKINPAIQRKLIYYLEILFQQKGSIKNFEVMTELFSNFFQDINYYNVSVNKLPIRLNGQTIPPGEVDPLNPQSANRKYILSYFLKPIVIKNKEHLKYFPNFKIDLTGKYLMKLKQYESETFKAFPVDTNIVYMDFIDSQYLNFSNDYYLQIANAYTYTKHQKTTLTFNNNEFLKLLKETIYFKDLNLILTYFNLRFLRFTQTIRNTKKNNENEANAGNNNYTIQEPESLIDDLGTGQLSTNLIFEEQYLDELEILAIEYKKVKKDDKTSLKNISRRWQYLTQLNRTDKAVYKNFDDLEKLIIKKYPSLQKLFDFFESDPGSYSHIQTGSLTKDEKLEVSRYDYINFLMNLYIGFLFETNDSNRYVELTINSSFQNILNSRIFIEFFFTPVFRLFTNYFMPGVMDYAYTSVSKVRMNDKFEKIFFDDISGTTISSCTADSRYSPCDTGRTSVYTKSISKVNFRKTFSTLLQKEKSSKINFKYSFKTLMNKTFEDTFNINSNNNIFINKQNIDNITLNDNYNIQQTQGNFFNNLTDDNYNYNNYIWKLKRNSGLQGLEDYNFLKKSEQKINAYLFYN